MITTIRNSFTKGTKEIFGFILLFALIGGMLFVPGALENIGSGIWAIKVNDYVIDYQSYMYEVASQRQRLQAFRSQYGQFADYLLASMGVSSDPKHLALDTLIKQELMRQLSDQMSIFISPHYISEKLHDKEYVQNNLQELVPLFVFDENGVIDIEKLEKILPRMGLTTKEFHQKLTDSLSQQFLLSLASSTAYTPEFDMVYTAKIKHAKRKISVATVLFDDILKQEETVAIAPEEIKSNFDINNRLSKKYWVPEKRNGIVWKIDAKDYGISISDQQIATYYEDNKTKKYIDTPVQIVMQQIVQTDVTGPLADIYQDIISGKSDLWADVAPFSRGTYDEEIERAAFSMEKGEISPIITTKGGATVVIKLIDRTPRIYKPLNEVEKEIRSDLVKQEFKKQFVANVSSTIKKGDNDAFGAFVSENSLYSENITGVVKNDKYGKQLFSLKEGEYDVYVSGSTGYIIELTSIAKSFEPELDSVTDVVKNDIYQERAQKAFKNEITLKTKELIADKNALKTTSLGWISSEDKAQTKKLQQEGVPLHLLNTLEKKGSVIFSESPDKGMIFVLDDIQLSPDEDISKDEVDIDHMRKMTIIEGLVASLYRNATIETNETIIIAGEEYSV